MWIIKFLINKDHKLGALTLGMVCVHTNEWHSVIMVKNIMRILKYSLRFFCDLLHQSVDRTKQGDYSQKSKQSLYSQQFVFRFCLRHIM